LNSPSRPSAVRDPSGKTVTAFPALSRAITARMAATIEALRSIGTASSAAITAPKGAK